MWKAGHGQVAAISFVVCLIVGSLTIQWARSGQPPRCTPLTAASVSRDEAWTERFAGYGDGNARLDDWTGADGTWSVRLPDGRTVWIFADTFLGQVQPGPNPRGQPYAWRSPFATPLIRNSAILQNADGALTTTLRGGTASGAPAAWIGAGQVYWPMSAVLDDGALRVFLQRIGAPDERHPFGVVQRAAVVTVPLSDLDRPGPITLLPKPRRGAAGGPGEEVFYGLGALRAGRYVYIYGATSNTTRGGQSAYLARVPAGRVGQPDDWEYWHGGAGSAGERGLAGGDSAVADTDDEWGGAAGARPVLPFVPRRSGVSAGFSVIKQGATYVLFTMDPTKPVGGISRIASYWSCDPAGPWHGPAPVYDPPEVVRGGTTFAYSPFAHPEQGGRGLLLSYDLNDTRRTHDNVGLYRPTFTRDRLRCRASPGRGRGWRVPRRAWVARPGAPRRAWPPVLGLALGMIVLGPALAPGFVLTYDMVFVPEPPAPPAMFGLTGGFPRPVPSDAVVAALAVPLPAHFVQKLVLLTVFVLAAWGAARLVPAGHPLPRLAAAAFYVWNPYVAERLVLGHWALLLGYAGLPWAVRAAATAGDRGGMARLTRSLVPAAVGGFAAMNVSALVVVGVAALRPARSWRRRLSGLTRAALVIGVLSMPWLVPAVLQRLAAGRTVADVTDPAGVDLFAARADTPFGAFGSLLSLGGSWNREVVPPGLDAWPGAAARLVLSLGAIGFFLVRVRRARRPGTEAGTQGSTEAGTGAGAEPRAATGAKAGAAADPWLGGLAVAAGLGLLIACVGTTEPGRAALRWLVGAWPVFGVLRDAQVWIAPLALVEAIGLAVVVSAVLGWRQRDERAAGSSSAGGAGGGERLMLACLIAVAPVVLLPTFGWGAGGRLAPVQHPADWAAVRRIIERDPVPGAVLSLPWAAHRRPAWNDDRTTLDPLPRVVSRRVVWNDGLRVGGRELAPEDPAARTAATLLRAPGQVTEPLRRAGYRYVVVADDGAPGPGGPAPGGQAPAGAVPPGADENRFQRRLAGAWRVFAGPYLVVYQIPSPARFVEVGAPPRGIVLITDLVPLLLTLWSFGASGSTLLALRTR